MSGALGRQADSLDTPGPVPFDGRREYLELLKRCLCGLTVPNGSLGFARHTDSKKVVRATPELMQRIRKWPGFPVNGFTMIGPECMDHLQACMEDVLAADVPGDMIETGVWRGGATILMRGLLKAHDVGDRTVFVADSFEGVPPGDPGRFPQDARSQLHTWDHLAVSLVWVKDHFARFGLLDDQVRFVQGRFRETLPGLSDHTWSLIRLDGDLYESTMNGLEYLYPNLSVGGYLIVDDYHALAICRRAVHDYREKHGIEEEIRDGPRSSVFWQKRSA